MNRNDKGSLAISSQRGRPSPVRLNIRGWFLDPEYCDALRPAYPPGKRGRTIEGLREAGKLLGAKYFLPTNQGEAFKAIAETKRRIVKRGGDERTG